MKLLVAASILAAGAGWAAPIDNQIYARLSAAQIVILGESHDNSHHHDVQAGIVARLNPSAVVYEMLDRSQAAVVAMPLTSDEAALRAALNWDTSGWPDFSMYYPIFTAAGQAAVHGAAVPRAVARAAMTDGLQAAFGGDAEEFGLAQALPAPEQAAREALQKSAHCDALPDDLLPGMVDVQRLRDARLAQVALQALDETGGPVVVITGNGHARADWGIPVAIGQARPGTAIFSLGQGEDGRAPDGTFDAVVMSPAIPRDDPCVALRKK